MNHRAHPPAPRMRPRLTSMLTVLAASTALWSSTAHADLTPVADAPISFPSAAELESPAPVDDAPIAFPRRPPDRPSSRRDSDLDGIEDGRDTCRFEAETVNGIRDEDGCPDAELVHVEGSSVVFDERLEFPFASAAIGDAMERQLLELTLFLAAHPAARVLVLGHTDDTGPDGYNMQVSRARALAVVGQLVASGIDPGRLTMVARGETRPTEAGTSDRARRANRRVELTILERTPPVAVRSARR